MSGMGVQAVVFDFGGVLITPITNQIADVARDHAVPLTTMVEVLLGPQDSGEHPWHRAERGELAMADIQASLGPWASALGVELRGDEMERILRPGAYETIAPMAAKVAELKRSGLLTALLTNTFAEFRPTMERDIHFDDFTHVVESFAVGARKPETAIYEATRAVLGVEHDEILYLDDFRQNIDAAQRFGWTTILVTDPIAAAAAIDSYL